jgi:hypothetical protein
MPEHIKEEPPAQDDSWAISSLRLAPASHARMTAYCRRMRIPMAVFARGAIDKELDRVTAPNGHAP